MVSPINGDKPIAVTTERPGESTKNQRSEQAATASSPPLEPQAAESTGTTLEVESARQLYDLESQAARAAGAAIASPEEARSLLDRVLEQFSARPQQTLAAQGSNATSPLAKLLQSVPG